jgi:hypothetical protein
VEASTTSDTYYPLQDRLVADEEAMRIQSECDASYLVQISGKKVQLDKVQRTVLNYMPVTEWSSPNGKPIEAVATVYTKNDSPQLIKMRHATYEFKPNKRSLHTGPKNAPNGRCFKVDNKGVSFIVRPGSCENLLTDSTKICFYKRDWEEYKQDLERAWNITGVYPPTHEDNPHRKVNKILKFLDLPAIRSTKKEK